MKLLQINYIFLSGLLCFNTLNMVAMDPPPSSRQEQLLNAARKGTAQDIQRLVDAGADIFAHSDRQNALTMWPILLSPLMLAINESLDLEDEAYEAKIEAIINAMIAKDPEQARNDLATISRCLGPFVNEPNPFDNKDRVSPRWRLIRKLLLDKMLPLAQEKLLGMLREEKTYSFRVEDFLSECSEAGFNNLNSLTLSHLFTMKVDGHGILWLIIASNLSEVECEDKLEFVIGRLKWCDNDHLLTLVEEVVSHFSRMSLSKRETRIRELLIRELGYLRNEIIEAHQKGYKKIDYQLSQHPNNMSLLNQRHDSEGRLRAILTRIDQILYKLGHETRTESQRSAEYDQLIARPAPAQPAQPAAKSGGIWSALSGL